MFRVSVSLVLVWMFLINLGISNEIEVVEDGIIHEAYVVKESGNLILEALTATPPLEIREKIPPKEDPTTEWIPGYWGWSPVKKDYIWVSGVWRRPPPGHTWTSGYWKQYEEGWVRFTGFWSSSEQPQYVKTSPPDTVEEKPPVPPNQKYFWAPGFWKYDSSTSDYIWYSGRWELFDQNWIYVPAYNIWREQGYLFIPGYWDWPLEERGTAYASVTIPLEMRATVVYSPTHVLEPLYIAEALYSDWPDYLCFFHFHYFHYHELWMAWGAAPPWWNWDLWWGLTSEAQWQLFWWWSHPGSPSPRFMSEDLAGLITPPKAFVIKMMKNASPPPILTKNGGVSRAAVLNGIKKVTGKDLPILPAASELRDEIQRLVLPKPFRKEALSPTGKGVKTAPQIPFAGFDQTRLTKAPERFILPAKPTVEKPSQEVTFKRPPCYKPPQITSYQPLTNTQNSSSSSGQRKAPQMLPPPELPEIPGYSSQSQPQVQQQIPVEPPSYGTTPSYQFPPNPMGIEHHDSISTYPHPQRNPFGPDVHPQHRGRVRQYQHQKGY